MQTLNKRLERQHQDRRRLREAILSNLSFAVNHIAGHNKSQLLNKFMLKLQWRTLAIVALVLVLLVVGCTLLLKRPNQSNNQAIAPIENIHLTMGNPSNATGNAAKTPNNYLMQKPQYVLSYNNSKHIPNWSSWQLNQSWMGNALRSNDFRPDPDLPKSWYAVKSSDYNGSGYDRGHLTPSADRDRDAATNSATFLMTNIIPQTPDNNRGVWESLESYSRGLVNTGKELYIIAGGYGASRNIGRDVKIAVPDRTWKVIVVLDRPGLGLSGVTSDTRVIAVDIPNQQGVKDADWRKFRVSVDLIEGRTGYDFLSNVSSSTQEAIESRVDEQA